MAVTCLRGEADDASQSSQTLRWTPQNESASDWWGDWGTIRGVPSSSSSSPLPISPAATTASQSLPPGQSKSALFSSQVRGLPKGDIFFAFGCTYKSGCHLLASLDDSFCSDGCCPPLFPHQPNFWIPFMSLLLNWSMTSSLVSLTMNLEFTKKVQCELLKGALPYLNGKQHCW